MPLEASYKLLMLIDRSTFEINLSVPVLLEYEDVTKRLLGQIPLTEIDIDHILDYLSGMANERFEAAMTKVPKVEPEEDDCL